MRRSRCALVALLAALTLAPAAWAAQASLPDLEDEVMCPTCGTALNVAGGPAAEQQRELIRQLIADGLSKDEIKDRLVAEYGREVLATPDDSGFDLLVWLIPGILAAGGLGGVAVVARRWRANRGDDGDASTGGPALVAEDERRLDAELAALER